MNATSRKWFLVGVGGGGRLPMPRYLSCWVNRRLEPCSDVYVMGDDGRCYPYASREEWFRE